MPHQNSKLFVPVTCTYVGGKVICTIIWITSNVGWNERTILCIINVVKIGIIFYASAFTCLQTVAKKYEIIVVTFFLSLVPRSKQIIIVIGPLIPKYTGSID